MAQKNAIRQPGPETGLQADPRTRRARLGVLAAGTALILSGCALSANSQPDVLSSRVTQALTGLSTNTKLRPPTIGYGTTSGVRFSPVKKGALTAHQEATCIGLIRSDRQLAIDERSFTRAVLVKAGVTRVTTVGGSDFLPELAAKGKSDVDVTAYTAIIDFTEPDPGYTAPSPDASPSSSSDSKKTIPHAAKPAAGSQLSGVIVFACPAASTTVGQEVFFNPST